MKEKILIIEDDPAMRLGMSHFLSSSGFLVQEAESGDRAIELLKRSYFDLVITDLRLPGMNGMTILKEIKSTYPDTGVIIITAYAEIKTAVQAIKDGAFDYIAKPFSNEELLLVIERFFNFRKLEKEVIQLKESIKKAGYEKLIGVSHQMKEIFDKIESIAPTDVPVLIQGESGTGKELVANAIHNRSHRKDGPYIKINCAAIPETLFESELFGHERGAFTGASETRKGKFELANGGTIFFDEIGDMPLQLQPKLLRVLEDSTVTRLGGKDTIRVDVRCIYATSKNLRDLIREGRFREDLYYRINVVPICIPPLRERKEDIPHLIEHFLEYFKIKYSRPDISISPSAYEILLSYNYPGNVRELKHAIERAVLLSKNGIVEIKNLPEEFIQSTKFEEDCISKNLTLRECIISFEKRLIMNILKETGGKKQEAARRLGISRKVLWKKLKEYKIDMSDVPEKEH
ncbi:MAG: sigma-54 dependent transcriptional regulator [Thermodesulfovibrionales bacterium]|nr:sigma-54 dependent transcriptional regulator [Thermodesulfovibrionales bacterium]